MRICAWAAVLDSQAGVERNKEIRGGGRGWARLSSVLLVMQYCESIIERWIVARKPRRALLHGGCAGLLVCVAIYFGAQRRFPPSPFIFRVPLVAVRGPNRLSSNVDC
jgi:hypothetical protein